MTAVADASVDHVIAPAGPVPPLTRRFKTVFGLGSMAEAIVYSSTVQFTLIYYNQVLGLNAGAVGSVVAAGLVVNAVFEPLIGSWSDRTRSRLGRRHPFMFAAIAPLALSFFAIFSPPAGLSHTMLLVWLGVSNFILLQAVTVFHTPHLAFGGELATSYTERSRVMSYNTFFLWAGDTACWLLSFAWFFQATADYPNGALDPSRWPKFAVMTTAFVLFCLVVSSVCTRSRIRYVPQADDSTPPFRAAEMLRDMVRAISNRNFRMLLIGYTFLSFTSGVRAGLWIYTATYYWRLTNTEISFGVIGSLTGYALGSLLVAPLHSRIGKRWTGAGAVLVYSTCPAIPLLLGHLGVMTPDTPYLMVWLVLFGITQHLPFSLLTTTVNSAMSDIADENELRYGVRQEGVLYSTTTLFLKIDGALGSALAGWLLTVIAFPVKAQPGGVPPTVLDNLAVAYVLCGVFGVIAAKFYAGLRVTKESHARVAAALQDKRAAAEAQHQA